MILRDDDGTACQVVGNAVQYLGITALRASSAAGVGDVIAVTNHTSGPDN